MNPADRPTRPVPGAKLRGAEKMARIPVKVETGAPVMRKPSWIRATLGNAAEVARVKAILRAHGLHTVCEEASCPNLGECFSQGTATFMIMGDVCTRRCPFCDVAHGRPEPLDTGEPERLASTLRDMRLRYVVITSVDRDDLRDGGAGHFAQCILAARRECPSLAIEILVPDFRGRLELALERLGEAPPDVLNHNLETVPRLYTQVRPGSDYAFSLSLLKRFKERHPRVPTKSGLMLGVGESIEEVAAVMRDLRAHDVDMLTLGQYLAPSRHHLPVQRFVTPQEFDALREQGLAMGFAQVASGPMVRSSYHADEQARTLVASGT